MPSRWAIVDHRPIVAVPRSLSVSSSAALNVAESSGCPRQVGVDPHQRLILGQQVDQLVDLGGVLGDRRVLADVVRAEGDDDDVGIALGEDLGEDVGARGRLAADGDPPADLGRAR